VDGATIEQALGHETGVTGVQTPAQASAARLAQIVNLHIAGMSLSDIGAAIGASADEVDRMLASDAQRYVRSQPALRTYVRNYISGKYTTLLEAVWDDASNKNARNKLEAQDRALRILDKMAKLHGAEAPSQAEVKVEAAPEAVEALVAALSAQQGFGYDASIFDVVDGEVVHEAVGESAAALEVSGNAVADPQPGDEDWENAS
jgi:hypothetical protein